jgi:hypothetical protein
VLPTGGGASVGVFHFWEGWPAGDGSRRVLEGWTKVQTTRQVESRRRRRDMTNSPLFPAERQPGTRTDWCSAGNDGRERST